MKKILRFMVFILLSMSTLYAVEGVSNEITRKDSVRDVIDSFGKLEEKEVREVDKIKKMFRKGESSGTLKVMYSGAAEPGDAYATAIGGIIKYELAEYRGFNAGAAVYTSNDIEAISGEGDRRSTEMSSDARNHTDMSEAFVNYKYENFNIRAGRQIIDTPLADTDDIRMIQNSFEAYIGTYKLYGFDIMVGNLQRWHGTDAGLEDGWVKTGKNGTNFGGVSYEDGIELDVWYYNISGVANAFYLDIGVEYSLADNLLLHTMVQYLHQTELDGSGVGASIYGALLEIVVYDIGFNLALNKSQREKGESSFSGFGGGALFTNMDTMILDEITEDREALSVVTGVSYSYDALEFLYAYGYFKGESNSSGVTAHIVEQNMGVGYSLNEEFVVGGLFVLQEDKKNSSNNWNRAQVTLNYNF